MSSRGTEAQILILICTLSTIFTVFFFGELVTPVKLSFFFYKMKAVIYNLQSFEDGLNERVHVNAHGKHIILMPFPLRLCHNLVWR